MTTHGYYQQPTIKTDNVVFVCEDDLWTVSETGGIARRLTANLGAVSHPALSPCGEWLAFVGREEGESEVYVMPALGGTAQRLSFLGSSLIVLGWTPDGKQIVFSSDTGQPFNRAMFLYTIPRTGEQPKKLPYGLAHTLSFGPKKGVVIGRRTTDLSAWKRYRGGRTGDLWIDNKGRGKFKQLLKKLPGNITTPMWIGKRLYFLSDHEGVGNLYSCTVQGKDVQRHTHHENYYVRHPKTDGQQIVYQCGADIYRLDLSKKKKKKQVPRKIKIQFHSPRVQRNRKFVSPTRYLEHYAIHPMGHSFAFTTRGKPFAMSNWEGAAIQYGEPHGVRYRLMEWLNDGQRFVMMSDATGEERLSVYTADNQLLGALDEVDVGRPLFFALSPQPDLDALILSNHRYELIYVDDTLTKQVLDRSDYDRIRCAEWSPDGQWVLYTFPTSEHTAALKLCHVESGETHFITKPNSFYDYNASFDPSGNYIYFLSKRKFNPVPDTYYKDWTFLNGAQPYLITLRKELPNPFIPLPQPGANSGISQTPKPPPEEQKKETTAEDEAADNQQEGEQQEEKEKPVMQIDLEGIQERVVAFPVSEGNYRQIRGILKHKVLYTNYANSSRGMLQLYDLAERKEETVVSGITSFKISRNRQFIIYQYGRDLRILKAGDKPDSSSGYNKKSGWLKLNRAKIAIDPPQEWTQMLREAWRLQRDHFWTEDMSEVDWQAVYLRYQKLIERVASRYEFSDLLKEMQGELGTSHTYEIGGDYRSRPYYLQGYLGADFEYDPETEGYRITNIVQGDSWSEREDSPLNRLGINVQEGDILLGIDGQRLNQTVSPPQLLVNQIRAEVQLLLLDKAALENQAEADETTADDNQKEPPRPTRTVLVKTLVNETPARYRQWVEQNRQYVYEKTDGQVGYLHVPNMKSSGYAEFHRYYLTESERAGLIVDVRFNTGGNISQLLLEKLARRRLGYDQPRYGKPSPYPSYSVLGPLVALANEFTASDGDIFTHAFKMLKLGKVIGQRTWGGVIGMWPRHFLVDGTKTTQPEFSSWFEDVGWEVENYGTEPNISVVIKPQNYANNEDPQLQRAISEILKQMKKNPPQLPDLGPKPSRALPKLPKTKES